MIYQITNIEFDFSDDIGDNDTMDDFLTDEYKAEILDEVVNSMWDADDEDDLIEEITSCTGWCIKSIDYNHVLTNTLFN